MNAKLIFTLSVWLTAGSHALAQTAKPVEMPSQAEIAAKQRQVSEAFSKGVVSGGGVQKQLNANASSTGSVANLNRDSLTSAATAEDFSRLARSGSPQPQAVEQQKKRADLMIFVSMSMPEEMLANYAAQAKRFNAVVMMRGFVNDKLSTTRQVLSRLNKSGAQWEVSPEPFTHFKIDKVPAIVMASAESASITEEGCAKPESYTAVFGDITVLDALDKISLRGQPKIASMAKARIAADRAAGRRGE